MQYQKDTGKVFDKGQWRSLKAVAQMVERNGGAIFYSLKEAALAINQWRVITMKTKVLEIIQEQPQIAYEKYEFCRSMNCPEIADKTHCDVFLHDCLFTAKRFHQWLQCHNFKIIKENNDTKIPSHR